jgi:hypothetical protein
MIKIQNISPSPFPSPRGEREFLLVITSSPLACPEELCPEALEGRSISKEGEERGEGYFPFDPSTRLRAQDKVLDI